MFANKLPRLRVILTLSCLNFCKVYLALKWLQGPTTFGPRGRGAPGLLPLLGGQQDGPRGPRPLMATRPRPPLLGNRPPNFVPRGPQGIMPRHPRGLRPAAPVS